MDAALHEAVSRSASGGERIVRLRSVMPEESPIDLDEHAAVIALEVERASASAEYAKLVEAHVEVARERVGEARAHVELTRRYVAYARRLLDEMRSTLG